MGYWLKLYTDILDDPKYFKLSDNARLGMYEIFLVAKKIEGGELTGNLPSINDIAFHTRRNTKWWTKVIAELTKAGVINNTNGDNPKIRKYAERQRRIPDAERMKQYRKRKNAEDKQDGNEDVTKLNDNATNRNGDKSKSTDIDKKREEKELIKLSAAEKKIINQPDINPFFTIWAQETKLPIKQKKGDTTIQDAAALFGEFIKAGVTPAMFRAAIQGQRADKRYKTTTPKSVKTWAMNSVKKGKERALTGADYKKAYKESWQKWLNVN